MMSALTMWLACVLGAVGAVAWGVRLAGRDLAWVGRHLAELILLCAALACLTAWAGTKPDPGGTNRVRRLPVGLRGDGTIMPYGAPIRSAK